MELVRDKIVNGVIGAGSGFVAAKALALGGITVTNPAMGALYGAAIMLIPSLKTLGVSIRSDDGIIATITEIALYVIIYTAVGIAATALCGAYVTSGKALLLTTVMGGLVIITKIAIEKIIQALQNASTAQA